MAKSSDPYKAVEDMYRAMSDDELWRAINLLCLHQQDILFRAVFRGVDAQEAVNSLIHSQNSVEIIFRIMLERSK